MYLCVFDKDLFALLTEMGAELIQAKEDIKGNVLWVFNHPGYFSFDVEKFRGKYFTTDAVRFDF